ncbi:T9SS type A sorting domain-containing protein [Aureivirga sp. CE67]|uniref:T9SS type A sorting domain-containing protein n=1 Tax=Aureivirga sp. CE67 TaxID=1788983 RepID=UPI0018CB2F31|nr:T9SS type A sorting domain-containing protein [Aureivirga sp. CE67]
MNKKLLLNTLFLLPFVGFNQNIQTPTGNKIKTSETNNFREKVAEIDKYWRENDGNYKSSGIKVYERWKHAWENKVNQDGSLFSSEQITEVWENNLNKRETNDEMNSWIPLGPFDNGTDGQLNSSSGQGRLNISLVDPNNPDVIYCGAPNGGLWKSIDHGNNWESLTSFSVFRGVSGIAVDYNNSDVIYISTGDEDGLKSSSHGIFKSTDQGITWNKLENFPDNIVTGEILIDPNNSNILWVCSFEGLFKSSDAGETWENVLPGKVREIRLNPSNSSIIYAVKGNDQGWSQSSSKIYKSIDSGLNFTPLNSIPGNNGRIAIAVTPANPDVIYALVSDSDDDYQGVYKSSDGGETFQQRHSIYTSDLYNNSGQVYYNLAITVSDVDEDIVYTGCLYLYKSLNGGLSFEAADYSIHVDIHDLKFYNNKLYICSDGGIYTSEDNLIFSNKSKGLNISEVYNIANSSNSSDNIISGLQDNGGYYYDEDTWRFFASGDGVSVAIDPLNVNIYYIALQYGHRLAKYDNTSGYSETMIITDYGRGNWVTPLEIGNQGTLYVGYEQLFKIENNELVLATETEISFDGKIRNIKIDPTNDKRVLVSTRKRLYLASETTNGKLELEEIMSFTEEESNSILKMEFNQNNPSLIYVTTYEGIYKSYDNGQTWENITHNLPTELGAGNLIAHQKNSPNNTVYLTQSNYIYYTDDTMEEWVLYNTDLPNVRISDLEINTVENHLIISTYGRGVWRNSVTETSLNVENPSIADSKQIQIIPNPINSTATINTSINEESTVYVYDLNGKLRTKESFEKITPNTVLNFETIPNGVYLLKIISEKHLISKKILIQK